MHYMKISYKTQDHGISFGFHIKQHASLEPLIYSSKSYRIIQILDMQGLKIHQNLTKSSYPSYIQETKLKNHEISKTITYTFDSFRKSLPNVMNQLCFGQIEVGNLSKTSS